MRIVAMGGGTGLSALLKGLKRYIGVDHSGAGSLLGRRTPEEKTAFRVRQLSAIVTVSDDGGSSGRLRREFRVLPPGDIRNCMVALSEDEALLSRLFQFRFASGRGLKGHSFGNLFLTALTGVTGDFQEAVKVSGEVLAIRGHIFPSTMADVSLEATLEDGQIVQGETRIGRAHGRIARLRLVPSHCRPLPQTLEAIERADVITLGPGSLFTSLIPNLLVRGVAKAMARSRAPKIYICNLMTQPGETTNLSAADHIRAIHDHCGFPVFEYVLVNTRPVSPALRRRYLAQRSRPVVIDLPELQELGVQVLGADLLAEQRGHPAAGKKLVRHHPERLARATLEIAALYYPSGRESGRIRKRNLPGSFRSTRPLV